MAVVYTVLADSERQAVVALDRLCAALGLAPLGRPTRVVGRDRWMARATMPERGQQEAPAARVG